ncbi:MAG: CHAT domain-containing protein [Solirubrobacteraceae bacterium]
MSFTTSGTANTSGQRREQSQPRASRSASASRQRPAARAAAGRPWKLALAVLNACETAQTSSQDPLAGIATSLMEYHVPAVVAMQFAITDERALIFADEFYRALADGLRRRCHRDPGSARPGRTQRRRMGHPGAVHARRRRSTLPLRVDRVATGTIDSRSTQPGSTD